MNNCTPITECLACGGTDLIPTLDLNNQPLANNFRSTRYPKDEPVYPLAINRCCDCDHLQLSHAVDPELIYTHYLYVSGTSETYVHYMDWYARFVREQFNIWGRRVLDIGCNDGSQLNAFKKIGCDTYGVDPAENLYPVSSANHKVVLGFWDQKYIYNKINTSFDVITCQNAFAHNPDPLAFLKLAKLYLEVDGKILIQTSQADMVLNGEFDTIYHEHISYYNIESMKALAERAGLFLQDVVKTPIHGTSYIFILGQVPANKQRVENLLAMESRLHRGSTYRKWAADVNKLIQDLDKQLTVYRQQGFRIVGYGAAAKGMTLINAGKFEFDAVIDDNPLKQGLYCPGTSTQVVSSDYIQRLSADARVLFVPLAWNYYQDIKAKIRKIRTNDQDLFLQYFPEITIEK